MTQTKMPQVRRIAGSDRDLIGRHRWAGRKGRNTVETIIKLTPQKDSICDLIFDQEKGGVKFNKSTIISTQTRNTEKIFGKRRGVINMTQMKKRIRGKKGRRTNMRDRCLFSITNSHLIRTMIGGSRIQHI